MLASNASAMSNNTQQSSPLKGSEAAERSKERNDVPQIPALQMDCFEALIGTWELEVSFEAGYFRPDSPAIKCRGARTTFDWLEGRFFLMQRFTCDHPAAPSGIAIIGRGNATGELEQHYYDSRGSARVYRTSCDARTWRVWRENSGGWERYVGVISEDRREIVGAWEGSSDGRNWKRDFGLTYLRIAKA